MRLIDEILAAAGSDQVGYPPNWGALRALATFLRHMKPQCFEISRSVVHACNEVFRSRPSSILSGMSYMRLPYPSIWLERVAENRETMERSLYADGKLKPLADRVGCFLMDTHPSSLAQMVNPDKRDAFENGLRNLLPEFKSRSRAMALWAWSFTTPGEPINVSPVSMVFDWQQDLGPGRYFDDAKPEETPQWPQYVSDPQELEAVRQLMHRRTVMANPSSFYFWKATQFPLIERRSVLGPTVPDFGVDWRILDGKQKAVMRSLVDDLSGEDALIMSFLLMLNSPTILSTKREDLRHLNQVRVKRGKPPLKDFIITELRLPKHLARHFEKSDVDRAQARMHMVRGHFKIRKTGVFWWTPYLWGKGRPEVKREKYATKSQ